MTVTFNNVERQRVPATATEVLQTFTGAVTDDDVAKTLQLEVTLQNTPDPQVVANCNAASGVDIVTAAANAFSVVRVGDVVSGDPNIPGGATVLAITPSVDGVVDDQLQLSAVTTGVVSGASLTFTGAAVTDPVVVPRVTLSVSGSTLTVLTEVFAFDGSTNGPSSPIDLTGLTAASASSTNVDLNAFLLNQRVDSPS